jgi:hypothetical protein
MEAICTIAYVYLDFDEKTPEYWSLAWTKYLAMTKNAKRKVLWEPFLFCCRLYGSNQRVDRVLSFFSCRCNWDSPMHPLTRRRVCPPPLWFRGERALSLGRGGVGVPIQTRGDTQWNSIYICTLWVQPSSQVTRPPSGNALLSLTLSSFCIAVQSSLLGSRRWPK